MEKPKNIEAPFSYLETIKPQDSLEESIVLDYEWQKGSLYGKPRSGHPEGEVIFHIVEVLKNVEQLADVTDLERKKLRLIAILHDTFKYRVDKTLPKRGMNQHGMLARKFAEKYTDDIAILKIVQSHDWAYNIWLKANRSGDWVWAEGRVQDLVSEIGKENIRLYELFYRCDNETGDKSQESLNWFKEIIKKYD